MAADVKIQRGTLTVAAGGGGTTLASLGLDDVDSDQAFIVVTANRMTGVGSSTGNTEMDDCAVGLNLNTAGTTVNAFKPAGSADSVVYFEIWEYIGAAAGPNEFLVRDRGQLVSATGGGTTTIGTTPTDIDACIPFFSISQDTSNNGANDAAARMYCTGPATLNYARGGLGGSITYVWQVVEFTGSNWSVGHGTIEAGAGQDTGTINLVDDAAGQIGNAFDVVDWSTAIIASWGHKGDDTNEAIADNWPLLEPGASTTTVDYAFDANHDGLDDDITVHVLKHPNLVVTRYTDTANAAGGSNVDITSAGLTDLAQSSALGTSISSGTGTAYARGFRTYRLTTLTNLEHYCSRSGNTMAHRLQVIDWTGVATTDGIDSVTPSDFRFDETNLQAAGANLGATQGAATAWLSDADTLAGSANEVEVTPAVTSWADDLVVFDLSTLPAATVTALHTLGPGARYLIIVTDASDEYASPVLAMHRPIAWVLSASAFIAVGGEPTTNRMTPPAGKSGADFDPGNIADDVNPTAGGVTVSADDFTEVARVIKPTAAAPDGTVYVFRALIDGVPIPTPTHTPQATIGSTGTTVDPVGAVAGSVAATADVTGSTLVNPIGAVAGSTAGVADVVPTTVVDPVGAVAGSVAGVADIVPTTVVDPVGAVAGSTAGTADVTASTLVDPVGAVAGSVAATADVTGSTLVNPIGAVAGSTAGVADISTKTTVNPIGAVAGSTAGVADIVPTTVVDPVGAVAGSVAGVADVVPTTVVDPVGAVAGSVAGVADVVPTTVVDPVGAVAGSTAAAADVTASTLVDPVGAVAGSVAATADVTGSTLVDPVGAVAGSTAGVADIVPTTVVDPVGAVAGSVVGVADVVPTTVVDPVGAVAGSTAAAADVTASTLVDPVGAVAASVAGVGDITVAGTIDPVGAVAGSVAATADVTGSTLVDPVGAVSTTLAGVADIVPTTVVDPVGAVAGSSSAIADIITSTTIDPVGAVAGSSSAIADIITSTTIDPVGAVAGSVAATADVTGSTLVDPVGAVSTTLAGVADITIGTTVDPVGAVAGSTAGVADIVPTTLVDPVGAVAGSTAGTADVTASTLVNPVGAVSTTIAGVGFLSGEAIVIEITAAGRVHEIVETSRGLELVELRHPSTIITEGATC